MVFSAEISTSKDRSFAAVDFVDTPGLVDGDMKVRSAYRAGWFEVVEFNAVMLQWQACRHIKFSNRTVQVQWLCFPAVPKHSPLEIGSGNNCLPTISLAEGCRHSYSSVREVPFCAYPLTAECRACS